jgi:asparagine synthase (glutamine-hydrolysing)
MLAMSRAPLGSLYAGLMSVFTRPMRRELGLGEAVEGFLEEPFARHASDPLTAAGYTDLVTYLPHDILTKVDIASMACSLEVRCPFLDTEVVEQALRIPARYREGKRILKRAFRGLLPQAIHDRGKMGFGVPLAEWLRGELRPLLGDAMNSLERRGAFEAGVVRRLAGEHLSGRADHRDRLWLLLVYELWAQKFLDLPVASR